MVTFAGVIAEIMGDGEVIRGGDSEEQAELKHLAADLSRDLGSVEAAELRLSELRAVTEVLLTSGPAQTALQEVAQALLARGTLSGDEVVKLVREAPGVREGQPDPTG